jgi:hypothetical protein
VQKSSAWREFRERNKFHWQQPFGPTFYGCFLTWIRARNGSSLTSISIVNRSNQTAFQSRHSALGRIIMATSRSGGSKRGFAAMDPAKQREIASKGGKASHGGGRKSRSSR